MPKTSYERESLVKAFLLFFLTIELFLGAIFLLLYRIETIGLKEKIFLEMKNYSYTFQGEKFDIKVVSAKIYDNRFYELIETVYGPSIMIPVPGSKEDALLIYYPWDKFKADRNAIITKTLLMFSLSSLFAIFTSFAFALYSLNPLRKALTMLEEVTRDIIHDLNTPIMTLKVNLKLLKKGTASEEVERAELALKQLENLKDNLSPLLKRAELKTEEVDLGRIVEEEIDQILRVFPDIKVEKKINSIKIKADPEAVRRIVGNLIVNAFKHNRGNWVRIELSDKYLKVENPSKEIKEPKRLFERYYRESNRGLGLGLSIVKKLSDELGWKVNLGYQDGIFKVEVTFK